MGRNVQVQHLRGIRANIPTLAVGELYFATDTQSLWVGAASGNTPVSAGAVYKANYSATPSSAYIASSANTIAGSAITILNSTMFVGTWFKWVFSLTKTAAGTAANAFSVYFGSTGTVSDTAVLTFTTPTGTAAADTARFEITVIMKSVGSGTSAVAQGMFSLGPKQAAAAAGWSTVPGNCIGVTSSGISSAVAFVSLGITPGASWVITCNQIIAEVVNS